MFMYAFVGLIYDALTGKSFLNIYHVEILFIKRVLQFITLEDNRPCWNFRKAILPLNACSKFALVLLVVPSVAP